MALITIAHSRTFIVRTDRRECRIHLSLETENPLHNPVDMIQFHLNLKFLNKPLHDLIIGHVAYVKLRVHVELKYRIHALHRPMIMSLLALKTLRLHHYGVERLNFLVVIYLETAQV